MNHTVKLRPVEPGDKNRWRELMISYATFYKLEIDDAALDKTWSWIEDADEQFWCQVAVDIGDQNGSGQAGADNIIGFTQYQLMHRSLSGGMVCYLSDLFVEPGNRGGGVGRALIDHVFQFARDNNISNVRWLTQDFNTRARKLYDSYGQKSDFILYSFPV